MSSDSSAPSRENSTCYALCSSCDGIGPAWADVHRRQIFQGMLFLMAASIACACVAVCGVSSSATVVRNTYWSKYTIPAILNRGSIGSAYSNIYGIYTENVRRLETCDCSSVCSWEDWEICNQNSTEFALISDFARNCEGTASGLTVTLILILVGWVLKPFSIPPRMDRRTDSSFQKCKGIITAVFPLILQLGALTTYSQACYRNIHSALDPDLGPGWWCTTTLVFCNLPILVAHIAIPVPSQPMDQGKVSSGVDDAHLLA